MTEMKFFVYGSIDEGLVHFNKIKDFVKSQLPASILGTAYRLKVGFPVVLEQGQDRVPGSLLNLQVTDFLVQLLDEFHGINLDDKGKSLYFRQTTNVELAEGSPVEAWTYFLNPSKLPKNATLIAGGDWQTSLRAQPPLTEMLTEKQKTYIVRLGNSTGREIIPIDLPMYRELMNLEMIVDKGRRIALSKSGHEVFRYLS
jgi:gamma-glutamylcyclotransferase (GGCT)/AIG2-like uncharacterized protein YtfP